MTETKRGALLPENAVGGDGFAPPDGEYIIKSCQARDFSWGTAFTGPAIVVSYQDASDPALLYEEPYSLGKTGALDDSRDGKSVGAIAKKSNAFQWLSSLQSAGFPKAKMESTNDVTIFEGTRVTVVNKAQAKMAGVKDQVEGKTIALIAKVIKLPGETSARPTPSKTTAPTVTASTPAAASNGNGDTTAMAIGLIQAILAEATDNTMTRVKLSTQVLLASMKDPATKPHNTTLKKLAGDAAWLVEHADGNWVTDGEEVKLA